MVNKEYPHASRENEPRNQIQFYCLGQLVESDSLVRILDFFVDSIDLKSFGFKHVTPTDEGLHGIRAKQVGENIPH